MGSKGLCGHARKGGGGGGNLDPIGKSPPAPDEISWFPAWRGGGSIISLECIRTDSLMEDQAWGGGGWLTGA